MPILYGAVIGDKLYRIDTVTGEEIVVGDGVARNYVGIDIDNAGNLYASALDGNVYKFDLATGSLLRTYAIGTWVATRGISVDATNGCIYVADRNSAVLRRVDLSTGAVTAAGSTGDATDVQFSDALGFAIVGASSYTLWRGASLASMSGVYLEGPLQGVAMKDASFAWVASGSLLLAVTAGAYTAYDYYPSVVSSFWGIAISGDDLYASVTGGKIWKRSSSNVSGSIIAITATNRDWQDICSAEIPPHNPFQILTPCTLQMLCDSKVANSSSGRRRTVSRDSSFVFSATLNLPNQCEQFESVPYYNFPVIGDCEIRQLDLVKYTFRDTEKTSSVKCVIVPNIMQKRTGDFRISCEPNISMDEAMLVATGSSSLEVLSSSRSLSLKCVWTVSFLAATQFIEWLRGSVNRIFTTSVGGMKGVACQIGDSVSLEIGSTDVKISADLAIVNTKQFPLNVTASRVGNVVTVSTGTAYTGTLVNRSGEIVEVVATATNVLTFTTYPENCYLLIREGNNVTEWLEL